MDSKENVRKRGGQQHSTPADPGGGSARRVAPQLGPSNIPPPPASPPPPPPTSLPPAFPFPPPPSWPASAGLPSGSSSSSLTMDLMRSNQPAIPYRFGLEPDMSSLPSNQHSFTFQANGAPSYPVNTPSGPRNPHHGGQRGGARGRGRRHYQNERNDEYGHGRNGAGHPRPATSDRPLLRFQRDGTPEQLAGMKNEDDTEQRFKHPNDLTDSSESMEQSDDDDVIGPASLENDPEPPSKKQMTASQPIGAGVPAKPEWTNAELYTALPPPDIASRKKKDIVKMIRKARVAGDKSKASPTQVGHSSDFIALGESADEDIVSKQGVANPGNGGAATLTGATASSDGPQKATQTDMTSVEKLAENRKRKRPIELEDVLPLKQPQHRKSQKHFSGGQVLNQWKATKPDLNSVPWHEESNTEAGYQLLHREICDFYDFVKPRPFEEAMRSDILQRLQKAVHEFNQTYVVRSFGSYAAGLYLPNADMDLVVLSGHFMATGQPAACRIRSDMERLAAYLVTSNIAEQSSIELLPKTKVPLIKFVEKTTKLRVDLSFENLTGVTANETFQEWKASFPAMPIIVTVIKQFLQMRGMNEVHSGGLGGFSVTCLVTSVLQNSKRAPSFKPEDNLGDVLLDFLDLFGNYFDLSRTAITMKPPSFTGKDYFVSKGIVKRGNRLTIVDPNNMRNDISGGSKNVDVVFERFSRARQEILDAMQNPHRRCLLDWMLGGDYNDFLWHRRHLKELYKQRTDGSMSGDKM